MVIKITGTIKEVKHTLAILMAIMGKDASLSDIIKVKQEENNGAVL